MATFWTLNSTLAKLASQTANNAVPMTNVSNVMINSESLKMDSLASLVLQIANHVPFQITSFLVHLAMNSFLYLLKASAISKGVTKLDNTTTKQSKHATIALMVVSNVRTCNTSVLSASSD